MKKIIKRFIDLEESDKTMFFLLMTTILNIAMTLFKLITGIVTGSIWFIINAIFYIVSILARGVSIRSYQKVRDSNNEKYKLQVGYRNYFSNGFLLILLGTTYFGVSVYMFLHPTVNDINGLLVYAVAFNAFLSLGISIYGMVKYKRDKSPIMAGVKNTNFCNALTSIVLTQVVLLDNFDTESTMNSQFNFNGLVALAVSIAIIIIGVYMVLGIKKNLKEAKVYDKNINS